MASDFGSISSMIVGSILVSVCVSMATVAHIGKRFGYRWRRWRTLGGDSGSSFDTVWKSMATVAHSGKRFRFDFQHGRPIDSGFDLGSDGHGGAHREAIWMRPSLSFRMRCGRRPSTDLRAQAPWWRTSGVRAFSSREVRQANRRPYMTNTIARASVLALSNPTS